MSDTYELAKAEADQSISGETPYEDKQWNFYKISIVVFTKTLNNL